jgi:cephalosporin-C deacetylase
MVVVSGQYMRTAGHVPGRRSRRPSAGYLLLFLLLWTAAAWAASPAGDRVTITPQPDGGYLAQCAAYRAMVGPDGNLHSLRVGDTELLDDQVGNSLGAFYFADAPLKLSTITPEQGNSLVAADSLRSIRYIFTRDSVIVRLLNTGPTALPYHVVLSAEISIVRNTESGEAAAAPANESWPEVTAYTRQGVFLTLSRGSRIWGPYVGRQVWEVSAVPPQQEVRLVLQGGVGEAPKATLEQLIGVQAAMVPPEAILPAQKGLQVDVSVENRSEEALDGLVSMALSACRSDMAVLASSPLKFPSKQTAQTSFKARLEAPDFYTANITVSAKGREVAKTAAVAGYRVEEIRPAASRPEDFTTFWARFLEEAAKDPAQLTVHPTEGSPKRGVTILVADYVGMGGKPIHGWFLVPDAPGKYPAVLYLSGYAARPIAPPLFLAQRGFVVLAIDVRGNAVDKPRAKSFEHYCMLGIESPDGYVYREILGHALRGLRALAGREEVDPGRVGVIGVSEGGGLALILAALEPRVRAVAADAPMLVDFPLSLRSAAWPYADLAALLRSRPEQAPAMTRTLSYFDVSNFAAEVKCPALVSEGFKDPVSLPTAVYGMYNLLGGPKEMRPYPRAGHEGGGQELWAYKLDWLGRQLAPMAGPALPWSALPTPAPAKPAEPTPSPATPAGTALPASAVAEAKPQ